MSQFKIKKLSSRKWSYLLGYEDFISIEDKYILGNGILIDNEGNEIWSTSWDHSYFHASILKNNNVIITDRFAMPGPCTLSIGVCCISMEDGNYTWKHWYTDGLEEKLALRKREPDINLISGLGLLDDEHLYGQGFKVKISDGSYEYIGKDLENIPKRLLRNKRSEKFYKQERLYKYSFDKEESIIKLGIKEFFINEEKYEKEGYFFNKCKVLINKGKNLCFIGTPAKRNPQNPILFKYSVEAETLEEIQLPFRSQCIEAYDFFDKGVMLYESNREGIHNLWLIDNEVISN